MVPLVGKTYFDSRAFSIIGTNGVCQRATRLVPLESKASTEGLKQHEYVLLRVWGSEETVNDYKARIRIFSVRDQDNPGLQERSEQ